MISPILVNSVFDGAHKLVTEGCAIQTISQAGRSFLEAISSADYLEEDLKESCGTLAKRLEYYENSAPGKLQNMVKAGLQGLKEFFSRQDDTWIPKLFGGLLGLAGQHQLAAEVLSNLAIAMNHNKSSWKSTRCSGDKWDIHFTCNRGLAKSLQGHFTWSGGPLKKHTNFTLELNGQGKDRTATVTSYKDGKVYKTFGPLPLNEKYIDVDHWDAFRNFHMSPSRTSD